MKLSLLFSEFDLVKKMEQLNKITRDRWAKKLKIKLPQKIENVEKLEKLISSSPKKIKNFNKVLRSLRNCYGFHKKSQKEIKEETIKFIKKGQRIDTVIYSKKSIKVIEFNVDSSKEDIETTSNVDVLDILKKILAILASLGTLISLTFPDKTKKSLSEFCLKRILACLV